MNELLAEALTAQAIHELAVSNFYVAASNHFDALGASSLAEYYAAQAKEEREHADLFFDYLRKRGISVGVFGVPAIVLEKNAEERADGLAWIMTAAQAETENLRRLQDLAVRATEVKDPVTVAFLNPILLDQVDEADESESFRDLVFGGTNDQVDHLIEIDTWVKLNLIQG